VIVADTDVLIDYLNARGQADEVTALLGVGALCTTVISRFELLNCARTAKQRKRVSELLDAIPALPMDSACADAASRIRTALEESGKAIGMADSMIAGIVASNGGTLLTRNRKHFERIAGLRLA
jgi:tRNA(fMet)-specific endonuclease VapC